MIPVKRYRRFFKLALASVSAGSPISDKNSCKLSNCYCLTCFEALFTSKNNQYSVPWTTEKQSGIENTRNILLSYNKVAIYRVTPSICFIVCVMFPLRPLHKTGRKSGSKCSWGILHSGWRYLRVTVRVLHAIRYTMASLNCQRYTRCVNAFSFIVARRNI